MFEFFVLISNNAQIFVCSHSEYATKTKHLLKWQKFICQTLFAYAYRLEKGKF